MITTHYTITFKGSLQHYFKLDVNRDNDPIYGEAMVMPPTDRNKYIYEKDGYLYIQGCRITNNKDGIRTIHSYISGAGKTNDKGESYVDVVFAIDSNGYVICEDYKTTGNQINRFLTKLLG